MDCIVHGVAKSQTRLSDFHFHFFRVEISVQGTIEGLQGTIKQLKALGLILKYTVIIYSCLLNFSVFLLLNNVAEIHKLFQNTDNNPVT